jgi:Ras-related GTP-binding protein A/B
MLIPNVKELEQSLQEFATIIDADEVLLFERATFLVISHSERRSHKDIHRFEKVSNIIKQFKLSCRYTNKRILARKKLKITYFFCSKLAAQFQSMEVVNSSFAAYIDMFTPNTYVMVILSDPTIRMFFKLLTVFMGFN